MYTGERIAGRKIAVWVGDSEMPSGYGRNETAQVVAANKKPSWSSCGARRVYRGEAQ